MEVWSNDRSWALMNRPSAMKWRLLVNTTSKVSPPRHAGSQSHTQLGYRAGAHNMCRSSHYEWQNGTNRCVERLQVNQHLHPERTTWLLWDLSRYEWQIVLIGVDCIDRVMHVLATKQRLFRYVLVVLVFFQLLFMRMNIWKTFGGVFG